MLTATTTWSPLQAAVRALATSGHVNPEHAVFVDRAAAADLAEWTLPGAQRIHALLTRHYRDPMEATGWDVDLLPIPIPTGTSPATPPQAPADPDTPVQGHLPITTSPVAGHDLTQPAPTTTPAPATAGTVTLTRDKSGAVIISAAPAHPVQDTLRMVPGVAWDGTIPAYRLAPTRRSALALREALTGHRTDVSADAATTLRAAMETPAGPDITCDANQIYIRFEHTTERQDDVKRHPDARWHGETATWRTAARHVNAVLDFATKHDLTVHDDVHALAAKVNAPFDYDGTIDGLRGVPVTELNHVQARPASANGKVKGLADRLAEFGISSVFDVLMMVPTRYMDRSSTAKIRSLTIGETAGFLATVRAIGQYDRTKRLFRMTITDGTGDIAVTYFNAPYMARKYRVGDEVTVYGRLDVWQGGGKRVLQMTNPVMDPVGDNTSLIVPVYPQSEKANVSTWDLHACAMEAVRRLGDLTDPLPGDIRDRHTLVPRLDALRDVHHPETVHAAEKARHRLAFDELFRMQVALGMTRHATADEAGVTHRPDGSLTGAYLAGLPYPLTDAQTRVTAEIDADLRRPHPMNRLLQGDVGFGKTTIALCSLLAGVEGGFQGALMAPTEILATQLYIELAERALGLTHPATGGPVTVEFLGGKTRVKEKRRILAGLADGSIDLVVGTHALLVPEVEFANLGIVVVDEQHRFGVEQRAALRAKGVNGSPDILYMTATPIPRTAALTAFGDLAVSVLDTAPPGRTPIETTWLEGEPALDVLTGPPWSLVREQVEAGRQAYVVASLVEDNENLAAKSAEDALTSLDAGALNGLRLGLVHGKQKREEREETMAAFKRGDVQVLVSTTVIEVGVNVPNATVMVILDATRFGLAQLHQLRGRVGRGAHKSWCVLTGKAGSADAVKRMGALEESTDGFYLSEVDLSLRGAGSIFGARQSGQSDLRVADLERDADLIVLCRGESDLLLDGDPKLARRPGLRHEIEGALGDDARQWLTKS